MSGCAGAGREHSQAAGPSWPMEIFHTIGIMPSSYMRVGWGAVNFPLSLMSPVSLASSVKYVSSVSSAIAARELATQSVVRG